MDKPKSIMAQQITRAAVAFVCQRTGHVPGCVDVAQRDEALVITLRSMFAPAGRAVTRPTEETVRLREDYRDLFADSSDWLRREIRRITGFQVLAVMAAVEAATGSVVVLMTGSGLSASGLRREAAVYGSPQGMSGAGPGATLDRREQAAREPIPIERPLPETTKGPIARSAGSARRDSAAFALWARPRLRLASPSVTGAGPQRVGPI